MGFEYKLAADRYDLAACQEHYKEMSKKGLFIRKMGIFLDKYEKKAPETYSYRLAVNCKDMLKSQDEYFEQRGWKKRSYYAAFTLYDQKGEVDAPFTRETTDEYAFRMAAIKTLDRRFARMAAETVVLLALGIGYVFLTSLSSFYVNVVAHTGMMFLALAAWLLACLAMGYRTYMCRRILGMLSREIDTLGPKDSASVGFSGFYGRAKRVLYVLVIVGAIASSIELICGSRTPDSSEYVSFTKMSEYESVKSEVTGQMTTGWSLLAPKQISYYEKVAMSEDSESWMYETIYQFNLAGAAKTTYSVLLNDWKKNYKEASAEELTLAGFDQAVCIQYASEGYVLILRTEKTVQTYKYWGSVEPAKLAEYAAALQ